MIQLVAGDRALKSALPGQNGRIAILGDPCASTGKGVIVYLYPKAYTSGCTREVYDFRDSLEAFEAAGYAVVGISPDLESAQVKFSDRHDLPFPLLSDADHAAMEAWNVWGEEKNYGRVYTSVIRSIVAATPDGSVALAQYNVRVIGHIK